MLGSMASSKIRFVANPPLAVSGSAPVVGIKLLEDETMAVYESSPSGKRVITSGTQDQCRCGKPAETEIQTGWIPEANAGAGGGQYDQVWWGCHESDKASRWEDLDLDEIPEIAFELVQKRKPIEVRLRACAADDWSNEQLVGFRLDRDGEYGTGVVYFVDANGREWLYCQVYRQPVAAQ